MYNWGDCQRPQCRYQAPRCANNYCQACCNLNHNFGPHARPWENGITPAGFQVHSNAERKVIPIRPTTTETVKPYLHPPACVCAACWTSTMNNKNRTSVSYIQPTFESDGTTHARGCCCDPCWNEKVAVRKAQVAVVIKTPINNKPEPTALEETTIPDHTVFEAKTTTYITSYIDSYPWGGD